MRLRRPGPLFRRAVDGVIDFREPFGLHLLLGVHLMANAPFVMPPMMPVASSNLHSVGHTGDALVVAFKKKGDEKAQGDVYVYRGVPASHAAEIQKAPSPGGMFHRLIKAAHVPGEKIEG